MHFDFVDLAFAFCLLCVCLLLVLSSSLLRGCSFLQNVSPLARTPPIPHKDPKASPANSKATTSRAIARPLRFCVFPDAPRFVSTSRFCFYCFVYSRAESRVVSSVSVSIDLAVHLGVCEYICISSLGVFVKVEPPRSSSQTQSYTQYIYI